MRNPRASFLSAVLWGMFTTQAASGDDLTYEATAPPLEITFAVAGGHYSGVVHPGSLFLQTDIADAPVVRWPQAEPGMFYTLMMLDFDGNANGSWPDAVMAGENSPVRHWIVGNIPGEQLRTTGYVESPAVKAAAQPSILQPYRAPHIPVVSDRYGLYVFRQAGRIPFAPLTGPITNFDAESFLQTHQLGAPVAANWFVALFTSESPFSGKPFSGNAVTATWHKVRGKGPLRPAVTPARP